jgi:hypothetical protein
MSILKDIESATFKRISPENQKVLVFTFSLEISKNQEAHAYLYTCPLILYLSPSNPMQFGSA